MSFAQSPSALGIDFGTSNSAMGTSLNGQHRIMPIEVADDTLPTALFFDVRAQEWRIGRAAQRALIDGLEGRYMRALKSILGTQLLHERRWLGGKIVTYAAIISEFLAEIKLRAEQHAELTFDHALSGRPVHFHSDDAHKDAQALKDLTDCYLNAGFHSVDFMLEPEAAALANGGLTDKDLALIVDIGGGTSDFCLFQKAGSSIDVLACHGIRLGGTNFDRTLSIDHVMPLMGYGHEIAREFGSDTMRAPNHIFQDLATWSKIPLLYSDKSRDLAHDLKGLAINKAPFQRLINALEEELGHDIAFAVEAGKIATNEAGSGEINLGFIEADLRANLSRAIMDRSLDRHARDITMAALHTLDKANCDPKSVTKLIFVGGSSLMQIVEHSVAPHFEKATPLYDNAFTAIVDGLAMASAQFPAQ